MNARSFFLGLISLAAPIALADGPADNLPGTARPVPPPGLAIPQQDRSELTSLVQTLGREIEATEASRKSKPELLKLLPDVRIYHNAVRYALAYDEFYKTNQIKIAKKLLQQGMERAAQLKNGTAPWTEATGLVARGYVSKIDGSTQPYGLVIPPSYDSDSAHKFRLDAWFHGRGETLTELDFINGRQTSPGPFTPDNTFVLHLSVPVTSRALGGVANAGFFNEKWQLPLR